MPMVEKPTRHRRTPGEAKRISYERDRRNDYGENSKASRKAIPKFKAASNRGMRHRVKQEIENATPTDELSLESTQAKVSDETFRGLNPYKRKFPDLPLGLKLAQDGKFP